ncbi:MAG TPA: extracellular solute-binding protein [Thermoanaerobaculia bacterium]|nr:extracellular solute-binding protein [Thermoanaerobaculia bacterium]
MLQRTPSRALALQVALQVALLTSLAALGCRPSEHGSDHSEATAPSGRLTVYSGRNENLIGPVLDRFRETTGIQVAVRYGETAELAATILEEGAASPADLFIAQDAAALGALAAAGRLKPLPADLVGAVPARFRDPERRWAGVSGRARVVVYNTGRTSPEDLPQSLEEVGDPRFRGRFGVAPLNASFQAHLAAYRVLHGAEKLDALLAAIAANEPRTFPNNSSIVTATIAGEVDWGLVNHYYLWRALDETPDAPARNFAMPAPGSGFVNVAGVGVLEESPQALRLVAYLLAEESQRHFAEETFEYPLVEGAQPAVELQPLAEVATPELDWARLSEALAPTLEAIRRSGLVP